MINHQGKELIKALEQALILHRKPIPSKEMVEWAFTFCKYLPSLLQIVQEHKEQALVEALRNIREIYAGMEGFISETAPEGYQQQIIKQMYEETKVIMQINLDDDE